MWLNIPVIISMLLYWVTGHLQLLPSPTTVKGRKRTFKKLAQKFRFECVNLSATLKRFHVIQLALRFVGAW